MLIKTKRDCLKTIRGCFTLSSAFTTGMSLTQTWNVSSHYVSGSPWLQWMNWLAGWMWDPPSAHTPPHPLLPLRSDWPGLNCWMHPKEGGGPSGPADNECPLSLLESERERTAKRERERLYSLTYCGIMETYFISVSLTLPLSPPSLFTAYTHTITHLWGRPADRLLHRPDIHPHIPPWPSDAQQLQQGKLGMAGVISNHDR